MLTDSHAHLTGEGSLAAAGALVTAAAAVGVTTIVNICTELSSLAAGLLLAKEHPAVYNVASRHPTDAAIETADTFESFAAHARRGDLVAIGETGLDYYYKDVARDQQHACLRRYLKLAAACRLPLVFHCREAFDDLFAITDEEGPCAAVLHCFTGNSSDVAAVIARGWYISFSGIITYKKNEELRAIVQTVPLERMLLETDAPYLAPQSQRGKPNQPAYLVETARLVANLRGIPFEELAQTTSANARRLFVGIG